jgi:uncharacterized protein (TIGR00297 family)
MTTGFSETGRQLVHIAMSGFALLLRWLTWPQAAAMAAAALVFNVLVLPRVGGRVFYRPADQARGYPPGILLYPFAVLVLILVFRSRLDIVAAAWGIMACGDGLATLVGRRVASAPLPWNRQKTVAGTLAFVVAGGAAASALAWWTASAESPGPHWAFLLFAPIAAALAAAFAETLPVRLDDNVTVPATAALVLWSASLVTREAWAASAPDVQRLLLPAVGLNLVAAGLGWRAGTVTSGGAIGGAAIGIMVFVGADWQGWTLLFAAFLAATATSRLGLARKSRLGIAEARGGRRGAGNAIANTGLAALAAALAISTPYRPAALIALAGALVAGASDTVASEIGKVWGRRTFLITTGSRVAPGTSGAVSLEGTVAGVAAAAILSGLAAVLGLVSVPAAGVLIVAATVSSALESVLGATLEGPGILNNDLLNFLNTASAAAVALTLARVLL